MGLKLYSGEEMEKLLKNAGFNNVVIDYFKAVWIPIKGYVVPKGMVVKGIK
jgi:hypothetical protein